MFRPDSNSDRLNYSEQLMPPPGYHLEKAVGTTYSLDLEALTAAVIPLCGFGDTDSKLLQNPTVLLNALQKASEKMILFCESGQIKLPSKDSVLSLILEKMIVPVALPKSNSQKKYPAFHPKTWILKYANNEKHIRYRFVILSRNLTFDRSWDVCFTADGKSSMEEVPGSAQLVNFLDFLKKQITDDVQDYAKKRSYLNGIAREISKCRFTLDSRIFSEDFQILPLGIGKKSIEISDESAFCGKNDEMVVISPFITGSIVEKLYATASGRKALFTRKSELCKLIGKKTEDIKIYTLRDEIIDGESIISDESEDRRLQDIHAKIIMSRSGHTTSLYLGSMNATFSAMNSNVEMLVRLNTAKKNLNYDVITNELFCGDEYGNGNPFEMATIPDNNSEVTSDELDQLEQFVKMICRINRHAYVEEKDGRFEVKITMESVPDEFSCYLSPLMSKKKANLATSMHFEDLELLELSEFYKIHVKGLNSNIDRVIMIPTEGIPASRENEIANSLIKTRRTFIEYIAFLLEDDALLALLQNEQMSRSGVYKYNADVMPALYEKMLKAALNNPSKLKEVEYIMKVITDKTIVPDEFRDTYETFKKTLR